MIFGENPAYVYGEVFKEKFSTPTKGYKIDPLPVTCTECPAKIVNGEAKIFFAGPIFNTYVQTEEDKVCVLKSFDDKLTIIKKKQPSGKLLTVKTVREDAKVREVELYRFNELFPGYQTTGTVELVNGEKRIQTSRGAYPIVLQNNIQKSITECMLYKIENREYAFVEINNPVERCMVRVVKDMKSTKIVENDNIRGVLLDYKGSQAEIAVYARRASMGNYVFVEDIREGPATVKLVGKADSGYAVAVRNFIGLCEDQNVCSSMKGIVYDIKGSTFKFKRNETAEAQDQAVSVQFASAEGSRTEDFETVEITKKLKVESEAEIGDDQHRAIAYIKSRAGQYKNLLPLINKYMGILKDKDQLCLFYLHYAHDRGMLSTGELSRVFKLAGPKFVNLVTAEFDVKEILEFAYKKKKSRACYAKLLNLADDKIRFIKDHREYTDCAIDYAYNNLENPRVVVESVIDSSFRNWVVYLRKETEPSYKRGLFRRLIGLNLKKEDMKTAFQMWMEFEESTKNGNVDDVKKLAQEYVTKHTSSAQT